MSRLTSFTSASDALIQPTGATNGQTLTWNATTNQFEPTTPASGSSVDTIQTTATSGAVSIAAWGSVVAIPGLIGNLTLNFPVILTGDVGKKITVIMIGNPGNNTITFNAGAGSTLVLSNNGAELTQINGSFTVEAVDINSNRQISNIGTTPIVAESGEAFLPADTTILATDNTLSGGKQLLVFTLPSAGIWSVTYDVAYSTTASYTGGLWLADSLGSTVIPNSFLRLENNSGTNLALAATRTIRITQSAPGAVSYQLRGAINVGAATIRQINGNITNSPASATTTNMTKVSWVKIGGFLPTAGSTADFAYVTSSGTQTGFVAGQFVALSTLTNGNLVFNPGSNSITLKAGKTYHIEAYIPTVSTASAGGRVEFDIYNQTQATSISRTTMVSAAPTEFTTAYVNTIYTPTADVNIAIRIPFTNMTTPTIGVTSAGAGSGIYPSLTVQQIGTSTSIAAPNPGLFAQVSNANQSLVANATTAIVFATGGALSLNGITQPSATTFSLPRVGFYRITANVSIQSATANARGLLTFSSSGGANITSTPASSKAIRLLAANTNVECEWVFTIQVTSPGLFTLNAIMNAASQINLNSTAPSTASTTSIEIQEIR